MCEIVEYMYNEIIYCLHIQKVSYKIVKNLQLSIFDIYG